MQQNPRCCAIVFSVLVLLIGGCSEPEATITDEQTAEPLHPVSVVFVDVNDTAAEIARQWSAHRDGVVNIKTVTSSELFADEYASIADQDVIIYPGQLMGQLIADETILPIPDEVWNSEELQSQDFLRDSRMTFVRLKRKRWATPLGSPNLFMLVRSDVLEQLSQPLPETWSDLVAISEKLVEAESVTDSDGDAIPTKVVIPTGGNYAANMFLAIAASKVRHRGKLEFVFDRKTMAPMIASPPYIQALEQLRSLARASNNAELPADAMRSFFAGEAAIAIGWPSKSMFASGEENVDQNLLDKTKLVRLPGNEAWYDFAKKQWVEYDPPHQQVDLIGFETMQASILRSASYPTTVYKFLSWLSSKQTSASIFF